MRLNGKVALISGGARGMGAVEAELFASHGAKVVIGDILIEEGRRTAQRIVDQGGQVHFQPLDVTDERQWASIVTETLTALGALTSSSTTPASTGSRPWNKPPLTSFGR